MKNKIYLKLEKPPQSVRELFDNLFNISNDVFMNSTYSDLGCNTIQCGKNKYRSIDDIVDLVHTYFPSIDVECIIKFLAVYSKNGASLRTVNCYNINKPTCYIYIHTNQVSFIGLYSNNISNSRFGPSWKHVWAIIGVTSQKELDEFIENNKNYEL